MLTENFANLFNRPAGHAQHAAVGSDGCRSEDQVTTTRHRRLRNAFDDRGTGRSEGLSDDDGNREDVEPLETCGDRAIRRTQGQRIVHNDLTINGDLQRSHVVFELPSLTRRRASTG